MLFLTGDLDAGSPADGIKVIEAKCEALFMNVGAGDQFKSVLRGRRPHVHSGDAKEMLAWFDRWLK